MSMKNLLLNRNDNMLKEKYKNKQWLEEEYIEKKKSTYDIANGLSATHDTINNWLHKFNIPLRSKSKAAAIRQNNDEKYKNKKWLKKQLVEKQIKPKEIANNLDISLSTLHKWRKRFNITWRPYQDKEWLKDKIENRNLSISKVAKEANRDPETIRAWVNKFNLKTYNQRRSPEDILWKRFYSFYRKGAHKRDLKLEITQSDFKEIAQKDCHYCGASPQKREISGVKGYIKANGLDRVDNDRGYIIDNIVPCCKKCNFLKGILEKEDFLSHVDKIHAYQHRKP